MNYAKIIYDFITNEENMNTYEKYINTSVNDFMKYRLELEGLKMQDVLDVLDKNGIENESVNGFKLYKKIREMIGCIDYSPDCNSTLYLSRISNRPCIVVSVVGSNEDVISTITDNGICVIVQVYQPAFFRDAAIAVVQSQMYYIIIEDISKIIDSNKDSMILDIAGYISHIMVMKYMTDVSMDDIMTILGKTCTNNIINELRELINDGKNKW